MLVCMDYLILLLLTSFKQTKTLKYYILQFLVKILFITLSWNGNDTTMIFVSKWFWIHIEHNASKLSFATLQLQPHLLMLGHYALH